MKSRKILVWFRNDLRLHDNEMLVEAIAKSDRILPVYFFDPRHFDHKAEGELKADTRFRFLVQSVAGLRESLRSLGGNLLVLHGRPEDLLPELVEQQEITEVYHHREVATGETTISSAVEDLLWKQRVNLKHFIGHTLYNKEDLPFPIKDIPEVFAQFRKKTERDSVVKECFATPESICFADLEVWGSLPETEPVHESLKGGEHAGMLHLSALLQEGAPIYRKAVRSHGEKPVFPSMLSPWLATGCLSPRKVYWAVRDAEHKFGGNTNFSHLIQGLLWRDFFRFMFKKHSNSFFSDVVLSHAGAPEGEEYAARFLQWREGKTSHPLVDRCMAALNSSGFITHQERLLVATFLIYVLKLDWLDGAAYFEQKLTDYSPASNWGNWANVALGGKEPRSKNTFDLDKQFRLLDIEIPDLA